MSSMSQVYNINMVIYRVHNPRARFARTFMIHPVLRNSESPISSPPWQFLAIFLPEVVTAVATTLVHPIIRIDGGAAKRRTGEPEADDNDNDDDDGKDGESRGGSEIRLYLSTYYSRPLYKYTRYDVAQMHTSRTLTFSLSHVGC